MKVQISISQKNLEGTPYYTTEEILESASSLSAFSSISCTKIPQALRHAFPGQEIISFLSNLELLCQPGLLPLGYMTSLRVKVQLYL